MNTTTLSKPFARPISRYDHAGRYSRSSSNAMAYEPTKKGVFGVIVERVESGIPARSVRVTLAKTMKSVRIAKHQLAPDAGVGKSAGLCAAPEPRILRHILLGISLIHCLALSFN